MDVMAVHIIQMGLLIMFVEVTSPTHVVTFGMLDQTNFGWSMTSVLSCTQPLLKTFSDGMARIEGEWLGFGKGKLGTSFS